jgi:hypothetical protein
MIVAAKGGFVSGAEFKLPGSSQRPDKAISALPPVIRKRIGSKKGRGYCLISPKTKGRN